MQTSFKIKFFNMKKLRIIVTSLAVLTIVVSAFAFKAKKGAFCVTTNLSSNNCTTYVSDRKIVSVGTDFKYVPCWNLDPVACTAANNNLCTATVQLAVD
jgi:hypothetical protein